MMLNPIEFARWLGERADAGDGYIMCAVGEDPKTLSEWYFSGQYSGRQLQQAYEWRDTAQRVFDCQGMADGYVSEMTGKKVNVRARNNYASWCGLRGTGDIPAERRVPGAAVFMDNGDYVHHVGFLEKPVREDRPEGDWWVIEAQGVMYGVVRTRLSDRNWNKWGWMTKYFEYAEPVVDDTMPAYGWRNLMRGTVGEDVKALQGDLIALGYSCGKWGADGEFGNATYNALKAFQHDRGLVMDGVAGEKTFAELDALLKEDGDMPEKADPVLVIKIANGKTWNIRTQPSTKGAVVGIAKYGEMYGSSGMTADGWVGILIGSDPAWVSEKAVRA